MEVKFVDLKAQYLEIKEEVQEAINKVLETTSFIDGEDLKLFEKEFADYCESKYAVGVSNGTDALHLILKSIGVKSGDEVILPVNTFIATAEAINMTGATPIFVDVDEFTHNISSIAIEEKISNKTRVILPVHLYGCPADMENILALKQKYDLQILEDAAQAHGSYYKNIKIGSCLGMACAFSFFPGKNLGAYGDAGGITTNDKEIYEKVSMMRNHGRNKKYCHDLLGYNNRLDNIQAAILRVKLRHLDKWTTHRIQAAELYNKLLQDVDEVITPKVDETVKHVYHLYVIRVNQHRDIIINKLKEEGISCGIHYPIPLHLQPAYSYLGYREGDFPAAEMLSRQIISLPIHSHIKEDEIIYVVNKLKEAIRDS